VRKLLNGKSLDVSDWREIAMLNVTQSHVKYNERQDASEKLLDHQSYLFFVSFAFNFSLKRYSSVLYSLQNPVSKILRMSP